jgi:hypothetical protein
MSIPYYVLCVCTIIQVHHEPPRRIRGHPHLLSRSPPPFHRSRPTAVPTHDEISSSSFMYSIDLHFVCHVSDASSRLALIWEGGRPVSNRPSRPRLVSYLACSGPSCPPMFVAGMFGRRAVRPPERLRTPLRMDGLNCRS